MDMPFQKDLSHLSWDQVYARQMQRAALVDDWLDALHLKPGDRVLEIGAGPGFVSLALAKRVGPTGMVYAVDRSADALAYVERLKTERGVRQIECITVDAGTLEPGSVQVGSALVTMVLHHADDPAGILRNIARCVPIGAPIVIGEFHPDGPCLSGPPRNHRFFPHQIEVLCKNASLKVLHYRRQSPEHYALFAERVALSGP